MKRLAVLTVLILATMLAMAQTSGEICNNGKDDDGNGFIDCYDNACSASTFCKDFFLGEDAECEVKPPAFPQFTMALDFASPNETTNHLSRIAVGDLNRDGKPEIITMNKYTDRLFILNGTDGSIQHQKSVSFDPNWEVAIANIDNDNCGEIFFFGYEDPPGDDNAGTYLYAYDCTLTLIWRSAKRLRGDPINYGLADFDGDGKVELYVKDEIFDAHTGIRLVKSTASSWTTINGGPVAVDIMGDDKLELVNGCAIYSVDLGNRTADAGSLTLLKKHDDYFIRHEFNATSVADYNLDGYLDILASGSTEAHGKNTTIFFWDVHNNVMKTYSDPIPGDFTIYACPTKTGEYYKNGWQNGTGRINIADLDGNGKLNISYVSGKYLYALDENLNPMPWSPKEVNEETSGHTGCTLFDFNGDGKSEIVYRDERFLYIINGTDGTIYNQQACISRTNREYPIVADVDADGSTELCVTCGFDDNASVDNFCNLDYSRYSHVRVFKSASDPWVPARRVWNQHGYFNVNVNDDLTIPIKQQLHHKVFSTGSCTQGPNRPLNGFLNQSPFLNIDGCPTYKSPDLAFVDNSLVVNPPTCPSTNFTVSFQVQNIGDIALSGTVPITFYNGNPMQSGAIKLNTINASINIGVDGIHTVTNATVEGPGGPFTLYIVLNDAGTSASTPITLPNTNFLECDYNNNVISTPVNPFPVDITALKVQDNLKCVGSTSPDNGAVRAFIPTAGGGENTTSYNFYWSVGNTAKPVPADDEGAALNGLPEGAYTVYAVHKTANCNSDTATVSVARVDNSVTAKVEVIKPYDNCKVPNGELKVIINDTDNNGVGADASNFTLVWYEGLDIFTDPEAGIGEIVTGLKPVTYTVVVTDKATGCQTIASRAVPDQSSKPVVTATPTHITCSTGNTGSASASVGGATIGYTFKWYKGSNVKPTADFTGSTYSNLNGGTYTVVAMRNSTQCESDPVTVTVNKSLPITVAVTGVAHHTSCDSSKPNGAASASVGGSTAGFTFEWFRGANTLNTTRFSTSASVTGLAPGVYTVRATQTASGCKDTEEITINSAVVTPMLSLAGVNDFTNCTTPNGSVTVNVSPDTPADYTFSWYKGTAVKATPDFTDTDNVLSDLPAGKYTVRAVHKTKHCITAPITATVQDNTPVIDIDQNSTVKKLPTDCRSNDGVLEVNVTATGNTLGFKIEWFKNGSTTPFATLNSVSASKMDTLSSALYTIRATNLHNGCSVSESFELPFATAQSLELVSASDATTCAPQNEGSIVVKLTPTPATIPGPPPVSFSVSDYVINFYTGSGANGTPSATVNGSTGADNGDGTANYTFSTLTPGFYTIVAVEDNPLLGGCPSTPVIVEIKQDVTFPAVTALTVDGNTNCEGATASGRIQLDIDGAAPESNYTYTWFEGVNTTSPVLGTGTSGTTAGSGEIAQNLPAGIYAVQITNTATQCISEVAYQIMNNMPVMSVASADIDLDHIIMCTDPTGGEATLIAVRENGTPGNLADYTFAWFDENQNVLPDAGAPNTTNSIDNLAAGIYFVQATKLAGTSGLNCATALTAFEVEDQTMGTIEVTLADFTYPTRCLQPANTLGELVALAAGTSTTGYTYEWYAGDNTSGGVISVNPALTGITIPIGQTEITFTVEATNNSNQCADTQTFVMPLDVMPVIISASAEPLTFCNTDDGSVFATVSTHSNAYTYNWYNGNGVKVTADFTGKQIDNLPAGEYTVVAVDQSDTFCQSTPVTVRVDDKRVFPVVMAEQIAPVTICDPSRPDGVAIASVDGDVINYTFNWYTGASPSGSSIYSGSQFGNLSASVFSVIATHLVTGCSDTTSVTIGTQIIPIPIPTVEVISNVTSCEVDNGTLSATVNGNTGNFIFHWYNSNPGTPVDTTAANFNGAIYSNLDVGVYYVSATSRITGCISGPANGTIIESPVIPDFDFIITRPTCNVYNVNESGSPDANGEPNGSLALNLTTPVEIRSITWYQGNTQLTSGPVLSNIEAGEYSVEVVSTLGCRNSKPVTVLPDINPFNGISRNGDHQNPIFHINCIENFPKNKVKIYNRAGTMVYEATGYDNVETYFDGKSNKGLSLMGTNLPDGTYFYIIDKMDGSKPVAGYLEVVN